MITLVIPTDAASVKGPPQGQWTYEDWETLPDDGNRYEVIDGVLYMSTAPSYFHQWIIRRLDRFVGVPAEEQGLACAATAPVGVPDLIVEVLSPGNPDFDKEVKLTAYANAAVPEYGITNPAEKTLSLYTLAKPGQYAGPRIFKEGDTTAFACLPTIAFEVGKLFANSPDTTL